MGHLLTSDGFMAYPQKIRAIRDMPRPTYVARGASSSGDGELPGICPVEISLE